MKRNNLPVALEDRPCASISYELKPRALDKWNSSIRAASSANTISVLDVIGEDYWGEGVTAKRISGALRAIGNNDVVVNINSPGGDMFEGLAIYNLLRAHSGKVTVNILGIAASAASIIAMAGDEIHMGRGAFLMIHNCWSIGVGNRHDFAKLAADLEPFDKSMADIYVARSGQSESVVSKMMDDETYIASSDAIAKGFADGLLAADEINDGDESPQAAIRKLDAALAKAEMPRSERRKLISALTGSMPGATSDPNGMPSATNEINPKTLSDLQEAVRAFAKTN
ncbi:Clp protease ClpP [Providencia rettgeri]|uniref:head maturation protease, ClpP-related n=1 Tax=Providencia TaxID=586 RepID=UPI000E3CEE69|nr:MULTISPECIES: head maturation protease, ClpP-related [Providencia]EJD6474677.1 Clp protease ClpP [Providencia rettgeri]ELR5064538.1 Clp protease ClpP [Providencia rettgeri]ELR5163387.1 Clp protease ClpP [Providencia rettgeri]ELR5167165.1 Clp protease ClpP [Providencia rettgeri]MBN6366594.1 Clp protease ClpP [Providencia rettgeri]